MSQGEQNELKSQIRKLTQTKMASVIYTLCEKVCLNYIKEADHLFKSVIRSSILNPELKGKPKDLDLLKIFHEQWLYFSEDNSRLQANTSAYKFDWKQLSSRQAEDALYLLTPMEREVFLYRFFLNYSATYIKSITNYTETELVHLFHKATEKVHC